MLDGGEHAPVFFYCELWIARVALLLIISPFPPLLRGAPIRGTVDACLEHEGRDP